MPLIINLPTDITIDSIYDKMQKDLKTIASAVIVISFPFVLWASYARYAISNLISGVKSGLL